MKSDLVLRVDVSVTAGTPKEALRQMAHLAERMHVNVRAEINRIDCTVYYPLNPILYQISCDDCLYTPLYNDIWQEVLHECQH